jgi:hypothetical protein
MTDESDDYLAGPKIFADGRAGWVEPTNYGARIAIGQLGAPWYDDVWDYSDDKPAGCWRPIAIAALFAWDGTGEPIGRGTRCRGGGARTATRRRST